MMGKFPLVTIVTPSFNQARFLEKTIASVLNQDYPHIEYIIMDGGSTDGSVEIIRQYEKHLAYWVSERDAGQADAINRGFARGTGQILGWLNSDDFYEPGAIRMIVECFMKYPSVRLVYGEGWYVNEEGERIRPCQFVKSHIRELYIYNKDPVLQPAAFWQRNLWDEVGPLDESLHWVFDWEWFIRAHKQTRFYYLPEFLANYRVQAEAKTRTGGMARRLEHGQVTRRYGGWWQPNHVVQQMRYMAYRVERVTDKWPGVMGRLARGIVIMPRTVVERLLNGWYMN